MKQNKLYWSRVSVTHPHYRRYLNMMQWCCNPNNPKYHRYGARGITVCPEWFEVSVFIQYLDEVLGPCPSGHTLDRIDNDGNYEPGNIRWATYAEQAKNQARRWR